MADKELRDRNGRLIGRTKDLANGRTELRDSKAQLIGFYDSVRDETRTARGELIGPGNLVMTLLVY